MRHAFEDRFEDAPCGAAVAETAMVVEVRAGTMVVSLERSF